MKHYQEFLGHDLYHYFLSKAKPLSNGFKHIGEQGGLESDDALKFLASLYEKVSPELELVLKRRKQDRDFLDQRTKAIYNYNNNLKIDYRSADYKTTLGLEDGDGRVVFGPLSKNYLESNSKPVAKIPEFLAPPHVTLFGPPDSAKLSLNAMNSFHRVLKDEPKIVSELLATQNTNPKWGADDEDSKTPLRQDLIEAGVNLSACFDGSIKFEGKELAKDHLALPLKRFPGLALPCSFLFYHDQPVPLHLYDFALHFYKNYKNEKSLTFYVPKLENEEEARYLKNMFEAAEKLIQQKDASYKLGTIRAMIVLENPRAIFRTNEIMDELYPYFAGASLGWHDYLAATARLFKEDGNYRIPVKADPNIVIKYIMASHHLLSDVIGPRGGIKVGGMYGVLPNTTELFSDSFQVTMKGYFKDVITQLKRNLTGFWVAHPDFVRIGMAIVEAWKFYQAGDKSKLHSLVKSLLNEKYHTDILKFIDGEDLKPLDKKDPLYARSLIVADLKESDFIKNNDPEEIRYNVFQSLQYLADWLAGNGCVALPALIENTPVRVMDDLATSERSRWEVWHELYHGRFNLNEFLKIAHEEYHFIRKDLSNDKKIVQVKWNEKSAHWYPVAFKLMLKVMSDKKPCEFITELLMPFTIDEIRKAQDPWSEVSKISPEKYALREDVERFNYYFERCGDLKFATQMSHNLVLDVQLAEKLILEFTKAQILHAAHFHGDIGESKATLDAMAAQEQAMVENEETKIKNELKSLGAEYKKKFGMKFLISAKGKSGKEMLSALKERLHNSEAQEIHNAQKALWEITNKRLIAEPLDELHHSFENLLKKMKVAGAQISIIDHHHIETIPLGFAIKGKTKTSKDSYFELASLSKTVGSAMAIDYFNKNNISLDTSVNELLKKVNSDFQITSADIGHPEWGNMVTLKDLMSHSALNLHYVNGVPANEDMPEIKKFLMGNQEYGYEPIRAINEPGKKFKYSGAGFIVLEYLLEKLSGKKRDDLAKVFLDKLGVRNFTFKQETNKNHVYAHGYELDGNEVKGTRYMFPSFAAGAMGSSEGMAQFLVAFAHAFKNPKHELHDVARTMLHGTDKGCKHFMGCLMGVGVFTIEAGENKLMLHQGANDGFRGIFVHCYQGPDAGKGFVILSNGELNGVLFNAEVSQLLLKALKFSGIDYSKFKSSFSSANLKQEEVVNIGYKNLVFDAFIPTRPEEIVIKGPKDPLASYNKVVGAKVVEVSNELFARAENLLSDHLPIFDPELFGLQGKIMDSWESVRHNPFDHDYLVIELLKPSSFNYVKLCTKFHTGNHSPVVELQGWNEKTLTFETFLTKTNLEGHSLKMLKLEKTTSVYSKLRIKMYPDGGFTRLGLYEDLPSEYKKEISQKYDDAVPHTKKPLTIAYNQDSKIIEENFSKFKGQEVDVASLAFGGKLIKATDEHYGPAVNMISPYPALNMFDGLESKRSRTPGHSEFVEIQLGKKSVIHRIEMDFTYFVNNNPLLVSVDGLTDGKWIPLVTKTNVKAFAGNQKEFKLNETKAIEVVRVTTFPDGGMNRLRVMSYL